MRKLSGWEGSTARIKRKLNRESLWKTVGKYIKVVEGASPLFLYFLTAGIHKNQLDRANALTFNTFQCEADHFEYATVSLLESCRSQIIEVMMCKKYKLGSN